MTKDKIKLGYELETGEDVYISPSHLIVTGLTQKAGKTTTLESLIKRSGKRAVVFRTKIGEKSFLQGTIIPPFFRDRSDWQFIQGLVESTIDFQETTRRFNKELSGMATDFFNKVSEVQEQINKIYTELFNLKNQPRQEIDEEAIIRKVIQKIPINNFNNQNSYPQFDKEALIREVLSKVPKTSGNVTYEVAPLEKIKKDFLEEAKSKIISDIEGLSNNSKKILKYLEVRAVGLSVNDVAMKGLLYPSGAGGYSKIVNDCMKELQNKLVGEKQTNGRCFGRLKRRIESILLDKEAKPEEIEQVYNHILMEMLK